MLYNEERKLKIKKLIEETGKINVNDLSEEFKISKETIRRDLTSLEKMGVLKRTHGGAILSTVKNSNFNTEYPVEIRQIQNCDEKKSICKKAASFIQNKDIIFIDNSSTLIYLPKYIPKNIQITIITNSINALLEIAKRDMPNVTAICLGGIFNARNYSLYGMGSLKSAEEYFPNKAFFSCAGISPKSMIADTSLFELDIKKMMIERAETTYLLADYTKFFRSGQIQLCRFDAVDNIITDKGKGDMERHIRYIVDMGISVSIV